MAQHNRSALACQATNTHPDKKDSSEISRAMLLTFPNGIAKGAGMLARAWPRQHAGPV